MRHASGIFLVDKSSGPSSAQVIGRLRKRLSVDRIGHAGTLDPLATGLLVVLVGRATRLARFAEGGRKRYEGIIRLGLETVSDDVTGAIHRTFDSRPSDESVAAALELFRGEISQEPPQVSALKVAGTRAYRMVRRGESVSLAKRSVQVFKLEASRIDADRISFCLECSKGFYVRSLARDLGRVLGCGGTLESLRRTFSDPFSVTQALPEERIQFSDMQAWNVLCPQAAIWPMTKGEAQLFGRGNERILDSAEDVYRSYKKQFIAEGSEFIVCLAAESGDAIGLLQRESGSWRYCLNELGGSCGI